MKKIFEGNENYNNILEILLKFFTIVSVILQFLLVLNFVVGSKERLVILPGVVALLMMFLSFLSKKGFNKLSAIIFLILLLISTIKISLYWGIDIPQSIAVYSLMIIMAGVLLKPESGIWLAATVSVLLSIVFFLNQKGILIPKENWKNTPLGIIDLFFLLGTYILMAVVSWLFSSEIIRNMRKAKISEKRAIKLADDLQKERDNLEIKVEQRTQQLRDSQLKELTQISNMAEFGKMAAGLLHDIKNPLTVISLNLDSLKSAKDKETLEMVNKSLLAAKTAETIIKSSQQQISKNDKEEKFDLLTEIKNTILLVKHRAMQGRIKIELKSEFDKFIMENYPAKISRILANLLMNAIDAFDGIEKQDKKIVIEFYKNKKNIYIKVRDNGCGIDEENKKNIFEMGKSNKNIAGRIGFGLYGSKKIAVEELGGDLTFESILGQGTEFTLLIPE